MTPRPILLVEDNHLDVDLALEAFRQSGVVNKIMVARDGEEAVDYLLRRGAHAACSDAEPCVVLLDLKLPKLTGLEVLAILRADPRTKHIPVVVLTASKEESDVVKSYNLGTNAYVVKPIRLDEFFRAVRDLGVFWSQHNSMPSAAPVAGIASRRADS
jgi:CheY-like chemotaxis protein